MQVKHFIMAASTLALLAAPMAQAQEKLRIGFLSTMTGSISGLAVDMQEGFELGLKQAGGRLGGLETELIVADDQQNPDIGKQVFDKLVKKDRVQIVTGTLFTNVMNAVGPIAFREGVLRQCQQRACALRRRAVQPVLLQRGLAGRDTG